MVFTCEHASRVVPRGFPRDAATNRLLQMHWGSDIGAGWLARELARLGGDAAILATVSRLVIDINRDVGDPTAFLYDTGDGLVRFNAGLGARKRENRIATYFTPFHNRVDEVIRAARPRWVISVHSFTREFRGQKREVEAGVLFDRYDEVAMAWVDSLRAEGFMAQPNEPYSGKVGLIYSPARHGIDNGIPYLELEIRQDLIATPALARAVAARVWRSLGAAGI